MMRFLVAAMALAGVVSTAAVGAKAASRGGVDRLKRMSVGVSVDTASGLDQAAIRAAVESKLRSVGIRIDPKSRNSLDVVVAVSVITNGRGAALGYAYSVHVSLNQQVYLARNPNVMTQAVTWETMSMRTSSVEELRPACGEDIARRVEEFLAVYRTAGDGDGA
jgi:hypothetical protein